MGKKSRKAKGNDVSRKERLQERRERTLEIAANPEPDHYDYDTSYQRKYFEGDRVWLGRHGNENNPNTYRGVVKLVANDLLVVVPLQSKIDGTGKMVSTNISDGDVFPDFCDLTLRFNVGDHVLCNYQNRWVPRVVTYPWPIDELEDSLGASFCDITGPFNMVPHYKCGKGATNSGFVASPSDDDCSIMRHPTSFRFSVGDKVTFNPSLANATTGKSLLRDLQKSDCWCEGVVTEIDITSRNDGYFVYECSFGLKGKSKCYILKDDDEHICNPNTDPRERLFEAISQDCTRQHLAYLATSYLIDIMMFRDMIVDKGIEYGSYNVRVYA
jgi:hypothetical protein